MDIVVARLQSLDREQSAPVADRKGVQWIVF